MILELTVAIAVCAVATPWLVHVERHVPGVVSLVLIVAGTAIPVVAERLGWMPQDGATLVAAGTYFAAIVWGLVVPLCVDRLHFGLRELVVLGLGLVPLAVGLAAGDVELAGAQGAARAAGQLACPLLAVTVMAEE